MRKLLSVVLGLAVFVGISMSSANAKTLKCQTVLNTKADEVKMLKDFTDTVTELTDGSLKFEILPAGAVVGVKETCLLYTSPSPRDVEESRMPSSA